MPIIGRCVTAGLLLGSLFLFSQPRCAQAQGCGTWKEVTVPPAPRYFHAMAYDSFRGRTVLSGGDDGITSPRDLVEWDGITWTERDAFPCVNYPTMAYDSARGVTVMFGYPCLYTGSPPYYTWEWDGQSGTLRSTSGPVLAGRAMAYDSARSEERRVGKECRL